MDTRFKKVEVIAWDLDTTLYRSIPELGEKFKEECIKEVAKHQKISFNLAETLLKEHGAIRIPVPWLWKL